MTSKRIISSVLALAMAASMLPTNLTAVAGDLPATVTITPGTDEAKTGTGSMRITLSTKGITKGIATNPDGKNYDFTVPTAAAVGSKIKPTPTSALDTGYEIKKITVKDGNQNDVSAAVQADTEGFIMPDYNVTVDVEFGMIDYTITKNTATNGTFTVKNGEDEVTTAHYGDTVTLTAEPDDGYVLSDLKVKDSANFTMELSGSGNTRTFTMPADNVTVSANFREKKNTGVTLNTTGTGGTASLMKSDYSELKSTDQVKEGEKFILCVNRDEDSDFNITNSDVSMTEFTKDEYENFIAYAKQNNISVLPDTVLAWVTMPYVAEDDLNLNVNFAKRHTFTVLYQPSGNPENVWCKFAVNSGVDGTQTGSELMKSDAVMADGTKVFSMKVTSAFDPSQIAFVTAESDLESATMTDCSTKTSVSDSDWTNISSDKYVIIGGDAKTAIAAFVTDPSATKVYKDNTLYAADEDAAADGVTYRLTVVTESEGSVTPGKVKAPAAPTAPTGKEFVGWRGFWYDANGKASEKIYAANEENIPVRDNATFIAVWKPTTLSVKLNLNGGTGGSDNITVTYDKPLTISENPTREGYSFEGWTVGKTVTEDGKLFSKGTPFDLDTPITADLELTAQWKHEHSYSCYQISQFPSLAGYQQYGSVVHVAICGCNDVDLMAHEFDSNGKCACGYRIPTSDVAELKVSYGQMSGGTYNEKMKGVPETAKKNQEVSICAPTTWGSDLEFSKWQYSTNGNNWYDLTADAYASFLIPCNMQVRALYVNPVTNPQVELFARPYDDQAVVDGKTYTMDNILFQMNYKLPDGYSFVDAGIRMGDNAGISYYELKERTYTYDTTGKAIAIGVAAVTSILSGGINTVDLSATDTYYAERENNVLDDMTAATLAKYMYESKPINVEKYDPIYWEAKAKTKGMSGIVATIPPLRFAQKNNQNHYIYGIGWMRYKDSSGNIKTIYTEALPATVNKMPNYTVMADPNSKTNTKSN